MSNRLIELERNLQYVEMLSSHTYAPHRFSIGSAAKSVSEKILDRGSPEYIKWLQSSLNKLINTSLKIDGDHGKNTRAAIRKFQRKKNLKADGIIGPSTEDALIKAGASSPPKIVAPQIPKSGMDWSKIPENDRFFYVTNTLINTYGYPVNGAAGLVGNLWAESKLIPSRIEGSKPDRPMTAFDVKKIKQRFTPEQVMNRIYKKQGPSKPGVGLAQWTSGDRRAGLFQHKFQGQILGPSILYNMDAQIDYLVSELGSKYKSVDKVLRKENVSLNDASDEVLYKFEIPKVMFKLDENKKDFVLDVNGKKQKLPRSHPQVVEKFKVRRKFSRKAIQLYRMVNP